MATRGEPESRRALSQWPLAHPVEPGGSVAASQRPRWSYRRRMQLALQLLADPAYDALLARPVPFESLPEALPVCSGERAPP
jgi:hypothetical protein